MSPEPTTPSTNSRSKHSTLVPSFGFQHFVFWPFILPVLSIGSSIVISMLFHWDNVNRTHCGVFNWLPTISAAVGNNAPQKYIFRFGIGPYTSLKIIFDLTLYFMLKALREHKTKLHGNLPHSQASFNFWNNLSLVLVIIEDLMLCTLTMISSSDDKAIHVLAFAGFMLFAHMHFVSSLQANRRARSPFTEDERRWYRWRIFLSCAHFGVLLLAVYLYWRHNTFCEPGVYSIFALCEYTVVAMNIAYHGVGFFEWSHVRFVLRDFSISGKEE